MGNNGTQPIRIKPKSPTTVTTYFPDGNIRTRKNYMFNRLHGYSESWYHNGQIRRRAYYINGKLDGTRKLWYSNGQLRVMASYKKGVRLTPYSQWARDGKPICKPNKKQNEQDHTI